MDGNCLKLENPITDAVSRIRFAPQSNNLLISSWDSLLRLYDVSSSVLRLEVPSEAALLSCCFQEETVAFSVGSDCRVRRYDLCSGIQDTVGNHDDLAKCVEHSEATNQVITGGLDKKIMFWDFRMANGSNGQSKVVDSEVESMSVCGFHLVVVIGSTVEMYDLRRLKEPVKMKESSMDYQISCICSFPNCQGYAVGSIEGRVALRFLDTSIASEMGCVFRCRPKAKDGCHRMVAVNDIVFHPRYGTFATGDNDGYAIIWDGQNRKRLIELQRYPNSVASLSYNHSGQLLAVASSYTCQEANEVEEAPQIFIQEMDENFVRPYTGETGTSPF
ncbi:hypothetical protein AAC387_Pa01g4216 [Persea americana]